MKISYNREEDILMYKVSEESIDYAEEMDSMHFTKDGRPVLLEILDASEFLAKSMNVSMRSSDESLTEVST